MNMDSGFIKLHRKTLNSMVFASEGLLKVWIWCLLKANHKDEWLVIRTGRGTTEIMVKRGEFIFGRKSASRELLMKERTLYDRMKKLEKAQNIAMQPYTHYTIVSVLNWDTYQVCDKIANTQVANQPPTNRQPTNTNKNDKNDKNIEIASNFFDLSEKYHQAYHDKFPSLLKRVDKKTIENGAKAIRDLVVLDGYDLETEIKPALRFALEDTEFWSSQVRSLASLRKKSQRNGESKFTNLLAASLKGKYPTQKPACGMDAYL